MSRSGATALMVAAMGLVAAATVSAQAPLQVGEIYPLTIDSRGDSRLEAERTDSGWLWEVAHADASYVTVHFAALDLKPSERLVISDPAGEQQYVLRGRGKMDAGTFWAQHVKGDTLLLELQTSRPASRFEMGSRFVVDQYAAGYPDAFQAKAICGADDKENAVCYASSHPTEYDRGRAVARLLIGGTSLCTGWLASADNHLITNEHCISTSSDALNTDYEFMAEAPGCNDGNCQLCYTGDIFSGGAFVKDNAGLDYALVQITSGNPAATYGFLEIDDRDAVAGEEIYIPQHPGGRAKELGIFSSDSSNPAGVCTVDSINEPPCSGSGYSDVGYQCDTEGGSSGSPVLARSSHRVIALHHCAYCPNRGVPIDLVYAEVAQYLGACGDGTCSGSEDPCSCSDDCGAPPTTETSCSDGVDNDCDGTTDCDDADCTGDAACICDLDGVCETGEDCDNCASDCISGSTGAVCGNGICEAGNGEDCSTCPSDCNGLTTGKPSGRFCCGSDTPCSDGRCNSGGFVCTETPVSSASFCCGDEICEGDEDVFNCSLDCGDAPICGDGTCDPGEDECSCATDCGSPPTNESGLCTDAIDNDCDGAVDCADADCATNPACTTTCAAVNDPCTVNGDCCSDNCGGPPQNRKCRK